MSLSPTTPTARRGRTLKLYLVDGTPTGVITAELGVSSVRAAMASRTALPDLIHREEAGRTGVYLLAGPDPDGSERQLVYVGEGDQVRTRLAAHDADEAKQFFTRAVLIVSKDENLTKAHGRYLESRIIAAIRDAGRAKLTNGTLPLVQGLPEPEIADMERVLDEIETLLPVLGFDVLRPVGKGVGSSGQTAEPAPSAASTEAVFIMKESGREAHAQESSDEFIVLAGSHASRSENASCAEGIRRRRAQLLADGSLVPDTAGLSYRFAVNAAFNSPSGAAGVIAGGSRSGPWHWKHAVSGETYGEWRKRRLKAAGDAQG